jgi:poly-gamma-glutamate synthesis protein (capsule biosynthesis protein)
MYDQGTDGIKSTIDILDTLQFNHLGAAENYKNAIKPIIIEKKGIKIGFIAFTTWINNDKNHKDSENCYKHILVKTHGHASQQEKEKKKITKPKKACIDYPYINRYYDKVAKKSIEELRKKVDFLIVSTHWGHEYHKEPSFEQKRKAKIFIKSGADLILGHHPHALQPLVYKDGAYIVYSMGNFISNQFFDVRSKYSRHKNSNREGIIYRFSLERNKDKKVVIKEINYRPIYIYQEKLEKNPLKISESYKIQLKQPEKSSDEYKKLTAFIGPTKIKVKIMKNLITRRVKNLIDFILSQI